MYHSTIAHAPSTTPEEVLDHIETQMMLDTQNNNIERLVTILAEKYDQALFPGPSRDGDRRIVALIGAGMGVQSHLDVASTAAERVENALILENVTLAQCKKEKKPLCGNDSSFVSRKSYRQALEDLTLQRGGIVMPPDFETRLEALCEGHAIEDCVREELTKLYAARHNVTLGYEILAHLFELKMLDLIINFNFDEILDDAIERIIRPAQYVRIISDGDYAPNDGRQRYIKPHGTISYPSSLRFRKVDYSFIPQGVLSAIQNGLRKETTFLVVGFAMRSIEFNALIIRVTQDVPGFNPLFFLIDKEPKRVLSDLRPLLPNALLKRIMVLPSQEKDPAKEMIPTVFDKVRDRINVSGFERLQDRLFSRAVACLFSNLIYDAQPVAEKQPCDNLSTQAKWRPTYLYLRTAVALVAAIARQKGRINLEAQGDTRLGAMYRRYVDACPVGTPLRSLADMCQDLGLVNYSYVRQLFQVPQGETRREEWLVRRLRKVAEAHQRDKVQEEKRAATRLTREFIRRYKDDRRKDDLMKKALIQLRGMSSKDIAHVPNNDVSVVYPAERKKHITSIEHWDALKATTRRLCKESTWNELWSITEAGDWVFDEVWEDICDHAHKTPIVIRMIVKGMDRTDKTREKGRKKIDETPSKPRLKLEVHGLPRGEHNRMLNCWVNTANGKTKLNAAIYSHRSDEDTYMSPVLMSNEAESGAIDEALGTSSSDDAQFLMTLFEAYRVAAIAERIMNACLLDRQGDDAKTVEWVRRAYKMKKANINAADFEKVRDEIKKHKDTIKEAVEHFKELGMEVYIQE